MSGIHLYEAAIDRLNRLIEEATAAELTVPNAMVLGTIGDDGGPVARTVLCKSVDYERGATFYTNTTSRKAGAIAAQPNVSLCFLWQPLAAQVTLRGTASPVPDADADAYWVTRQRESQVGAWASLQSQPLAHRDELLERFESFRAKFAGGDVPRPPHWSGYAVRPTQIEFWRGGEHRLNHRSEVWLDSATGVWRERLLFP